MKRALELSGFESQPNSSSPASPQYSVALAWILVNYMQNTRFFKFPASSPPLQWHYDQSWSTVSDWNLSRRQILKVKLFRENKHRTNLKIKRASKLLWAIEQDITIGIPVFIFYWWKMSQEHCEVHFYYIYMLKQKKTPPTSDQILMKMALL